MTRSAYLQVRCAVVALWSEHPARYALQTRLARAELDSFLPTLSDLAELVLSGLRTHDPSTRPRAAADLVLASLTDVPPVGIDIRSGGGRVGLDRLLDALAATK